jgi:predicted GNAT family acetyltransferase
VRNFAINTLHPLDNPGWHAALTTHARFTSGTALVKRFPQELGSLVALADHSDAALHDMAEIVSPSENIFLFEAELPDLPGWTVHFRGDVLQMISTKPLSVQDDNAEILTLTADDVPEMFALIELNRPGPFFERTIELGHYIGIRQNGELVAMAGERICLSGYHEISAVCTHPEYEGRGYARRLVASLVNENWQNGVIPYLHVLPDNSRAIRLYERLGFQSRRQMQILAANR